MEKLADPGGRILQQSRGILQKTAKKTGVSEENRLLFGLLQRGINPQPDIKKDQPKRDPVVFA